MIKLYDGNFSVRNCAECGVRMEGKDMFIVSFVFGRMETRICRACLHELENESMATVRLDKMKNG